MQILCRWPRKIRGGSEIYFPGQADHLQQLVNPLLPPNSPKLIFCAAFFGDDIL